MLSFFGSVYPMRIDHNDIDRYLLCNKKEEFIGVIAMKDYKYEN